MKFQLVIFGCLIALAACKPTEDAGMAQLLLRSCDHNADNALNAAEFAGCLMQTARQQSAAAHGMAISRSELLQSFMDEADMNNDLRADGKELQEWSQRNFLSDLFGGNDGDDGNDDDGGFAFIEIIGKIGRILQYFSEENYVGAAIELYALISGYEFSASSQASISSAILAIEDGNYGEAIGYIYSVIREIAGGDDAGGIFVVSANTVTSVASLLQAVIEGDSANINFFIYRSLAGIIVDFSFISQESASAVAALIQSVVENNSDEFYISLQVIIKDIPGISSSTATALTELLQTVVSGESSEVSVKILAVLSSLVADESGAEFVQIFVSVLNAILDGDIEEAIEQLTVIYSLITGGSTSGSGFSSTMVVSFGAIIEAVQEGRGVEAVSQINDLIGNSNSGLSSSQISTLRVIIGMIDDGDDDDAITELIALVTSSGSSSSSSTSVEISVDVFVTLSSVISALENSDDPDDIIVLIEDILSDSSITISVEVRSALRALITVLSEESTEEALLVATAILTGSSGVFERTISSEVASELELVLTAIRGEDSDAAIVIIEALLDGERGGSSLSVVVKNDLRIVLSSLEKEDYEYAFALLTVISVGRRSSSFSSSVAASILVAFEYLSTSSQSDAIAVLKGILEDDGIESGFASEIQDLIRVIENDGSSSARTTLLGFLFESSYSVSLSLSQIVFKVIQLAVSRNFEGAIETIEDILNDLHPDLHLLFLLLIRRLRAGDFLGVVNVANFITSVVN